MSSVHAALDQPFGRGRVSWSSCAALAACFREIRHSTAVLLMLGFPSLGQESFLLARCGAFVLSLGKGSWSLPFAAAFVGPAMANFIAHRSAGDELSLASLGVQRKRLGERVQAFSLAPSYRWYS